ncbi:MAG: 5'-methylthioadenosine/adenosylhomocysteine nucleosidase [Treponema sp.]|nr:5'-methylthioadenosine/adenosylhomocysteine nucleosidase [Treponema sp.]
MGNVIGIIGAMDSEVSFLCKNLSNPEKIEYNGLVYNKGQIGSQSVVVVKSGIGKVNAAICAQTLILKFGATKVINTGIAGATGGNLKIFDFVVSEEVVYHDFDTTAFGYKLGQVPGLTPTFKADSEMTQKVLEAFEKSDFVNERTMKKGLIASGDQFISAGERKDFIKSNFNPLCVEMEGCAIGHACSVNKVPFVIIRCMSDMADETVESTYSFNEDVCADMCANLVLNFLKLL